MKRTIAALLAIFALQQIEAQNALHFDGSNDYVQTNYDGVTGSNDRTFEAWVKVDIGASASNLCIMDYGVNAAGKRNSFSVKGDRGLTFISGGTNANISSPANGITEGQWTHVAFVLDNGTGYLYINGTQVGTGNLSSVNTPATNTDVRIGQRVAGGNIPFEGAIDEVRIWNVARSASQLSADRNSEYCTLPANLKAYYNMNHGVAGSSNTGVNRALDAVGGKDGILNNFSLTGSSSNWVVGSGITAGLSVSRMVTTVCDSFVSPSGNHVWTASGKYQDTLVNAVSCDSLINVNLTVNNSLYTYVQDSVCEPYESPSGNYIYTESGTYFDTIQLPNGCYGLFELELEISIIDTTVSKTGHTLTSNQANAQHYIWLDCDDNFSQIGGSTNQSFTPTQDGNYAVRVTLNGCVDTSECLEVIGVGLQELGATSARIYPNPASDILYVTYRENQSDLNYIVFSSTGQQVMKGRLEEKIDVSALDQGLYWIKVIGDGEILSHRFMKN